MAVMVELETLVEHSNEYGEKAAKAKGAKYEAPEQAAQALVANGYAKDTKGHFKPDAKKEG